jgi:hypothetical protein
LNANNPKAPEYQLIKKLKINKKEGGWKENKKDNQSKITNSSRDQ